MSFLNTAHRAGQGCSDCLAAFHAENSTELLVGPSGALAPIVFNTIPFNQGFNRNDPSGYFGLTGISGTSGVFFAPCNGIYRFTVHLTLLNTGCTGPVAASVQLISNGAVAVSVPVNGIDGFPAVVDFTRTVRLCTRQPIFVSILNQSGCTLTILPGSYFEGAREERFLRCPFSSVA